MKTNNYEKSLPESYSVALHINAASKKFGAILNIIALLIAAIITFIAALFIDSERLSGADAYILPTLLIFYVAMLLYLALHELTHGAAYKILTGEKLTFGMKWSCAFCGVPDIYIYRRASIIASAAPLIVFTVIFSALTAALYFLHPIPYIFSAIILGFHLGGCSGDIYVLLLLFFRFKGKDTLVRDTGPEQFFYVKNSDR